MKFYLYKNWKDTPDRFDKPYQTVGQPMKSSDKLRVMESFLDKLSGTFLIEVRYPDNFRNALVGNPKECKAFISTCFNEDKTP